MRGEKRRIKQCLSHWCAVYAAVWKLFWFQLEKVRGSHRKYLCVFAHTESIIRSSFFVGSGPNNERRQIQ